MWRSWVFTSWFFRRLSLWHGSWFFVLRHFKPTPDLVGIHRWDGPWTSGRYEKTVSQIQRLVTFPCCAGLVGCILTGKDGSYVPDPVFCTPLLPCLTLLHWRPFGFRDRFVFTWVAELVFGQSLVCMTFKQANRLWWMGIDTAVFVATLTRTLTIYRRNRTGAVVPLIKVMMRDGEWHFQCWGTKFRQLTFGCFH